MGSFCGTLWIFTPLTLASALACSAESGLGAAGAAAGTGATGGSVAASGGSGGSVATGGGGGEPICPKGPGYEVAGQAQWVGQVTARLFDQAGTPAANVPVLVCGFGACSSFGSTSDQGEVCTPDKASGLCTPGMAPGLEITRPALKYGLGVEYVKFAQLLPTEGTEHAVGDVTAIRLPAVAEGSEIVAGASATSNGVTLSLASGTSIEHDILVFDTPELQRFRAIQVPLGKAPPAVDTSVGFELLVATTPVDAKFCPHASLSLPNSAGWAPGTAVELWVHGVTLDEEWAPYGGWGKVSGGTVSSDGARIETNADEGVPMLGLFGVRKAQ